MCYADVTLFQDSCPFGLSDANSVTAAVPFCSCVMTSTQNVQVCNAILSLCLSVHASAPTVKMAYDIQDMRCQALAFTVC